MLAVFLISSYVNGSLVVMGLGYKSKHCNVPFGETLNPNWGVASWLRNELNTFTFHLKGGLTT